jgi:Raf kinase inhibitor-like YbhB/YbcL family protein
MKITSPAFKDNEMIPTKYTCDGQDVNPALVFSDIPQKAQTLALIVDDPDAPSGTWVHWVVWNLDPRCDTIIENYTSENAIEATIEMESVEGTNSAETTGYHGPCPPLGIHHYHFKLYALDQEIHLSPESGKEDLEKAMRGHIIDQTELIGLYERK